MVQSDGDDDDDGNIRVSEERSSFNIKYDDDDDVRRHWIKNDGVMTILPSPLMTPPLELVEEAPRI